MVGVLLVVRRELSNSDVGSDSVVEKDKLGLRSTREVSKVMSTDVGCVMVMSGLK
jgi:hypothetical protein